MTTYHVTATSADGARWAASFIDARSPDHARRTLAARKARDWNVARYTLTTTCEGHVTSAVRRRGIAAQYETVD